MKDVQLVITMDNLGSIIKDVVFEAKVLDKYRTFD